MDELLAMQSTTRCFNQRVDSYRRRLLQYAVIQDASGIPGPPPLENILKIDIKNREVGFSTSFSRIVMATLISKFC